MSRPETKVIIYATGEKISIRNVTVMYSEDRASFASEAVRLRLHFLLEENISAYFFLYQWMELALRGSPLFQAEPGKTRWLTAEVLMIDALRNVQSAAKYDASICTSLRISGLGAPSNHEVHADLLCISPNKQR